MDRVGSVISHYRIERALGSGGMGDVYLAEDIHLDRRVALKFIAPHLARDREIIERFRNEARIAARLDHANIGRVYDFGEADGQWFLVLEYVDGESLRHRIRHDGLPVDTVVRIGASLADGLVHAHSHGIVHRDIKSGNILLADGDVPKILDFGLARRDDASLLTTTGAIVGTPAYMSPEQVRGGRADARSDLWSLGVVLYECLTGSLPFSGETTEVLLHQIVRESPEPPSTMRSAVPAGLERIVLRCLAKDPEHRYQHAGELLAAMGRLLPDTSPERSSMTSEPTVPMGQAARPARRHRFAMLAGALGIPVLALALWLLPRSDQGLPRGGTNAPTPNWILVADFATNPPDSQLSEAARELTVSSLAQSGIVTPLSRQQVRRGLELAGRSPHTFVSGDLARELAYRVSIPVYLEGRVDRVASSFSVVLNAIDVEHRRILWSVNAIAADEDALIGTLDELARDMRTEMGEHQEAVRSSRPLREVATASFPAFERYVQAQASHWEGQYDKALKLSREAIALDPEFAMAWGEMAIIQWNRYEFDSCRVAYEKARSLPERLTECNRLALDAQWSGAVEADGEAALQVLGEMAGRCPGRDLYNNRAVILAAMGRKEEALRIFEDYRTRAPYTRYQIVVHNHFLALLANGRLKEAEDVIPELTGPRWSQTRCRMQLALAAGRWGEAREHATALLVEPGNVPFNRDIARAALAGLDVLQGRSGRALDSLAVLCSQEFSSARIPYARSLQQTLRIVQGFTPDFDALPAAYGPTQFNLANRVIWAAESGRTEAESLLAEYEELPGPSRFKVEIVYARARLLANAGDWEGVIGLLSPLAIEGPRGSFGRQPIQWLLSLAQENLGQLEEAAAQLEYLRAGTGCYYWRDWPLRAIYHPYALARLVGIYARLDRREEARKRLEDLDGVFTDPDSLGRDLLKRSGALVQEI